MIDKEKRYRDVIADLENEIGRLKRQNAALSGALEFYANEDNYMDTSIEEMAEMARQALA